MNISSLRGAVGLLIAGVITACSAVAPAEAPAPAPQVKVATEEAKAAVVEAEQPAAEAEEVAAETQKPAVEPIEIILAIGGEADEGYDPTLGWGRYGSPLFRAPCCAVTRP